MLLRRLINNYLMIVHMLYRSSYVVDVGCGKGRFYGRLKIIDRVLGLGKINSAYSIGFDIYLPYLRVAKKVYDDAVLCDVRFLPLRPKCCDVVFATEVIEHLDKRHGYRLLADLHAIARKQILVTTPVGWNPKHHLEDGNPWQAHRSWWYPSEFRKLGFKVRGFGGLRVFA